MKRHRPARPTASGSTAFVGFRFAPEVILLAVRWYLRFGLSYRDLEELLAERGIDVDLVSGRAKAAGSNPLTGQAACPGTRPITSLKPTAPTIGLWSALSAIVNLQRGVGGG